MLVAVNIGNGLIVWHTLEQWERFMRGLDREAVKALAEEKPCRS